MDNQTSFNLNWKSMDEMRQSLLLLTMELEDTRLKEQEEIKVRDCEIARLKDMLNRVMKERDDLLLKKLLLQQQQSAPHSGISSTEDDHPRIGIDSSNGFSSSECEESIVSSPLQLPPAEPELELPIPIVIDRPLPEKGKLLQAVMKAGPLLQNLLLVGPLPQWRHPPPPLDTYQIPPPPVIVPPPAMPAQFINKDSLHNIIPTNNNVNSCNKINKKRGLSDSYIDLKYQKVSL